LGGLIRFFNHEPDSGPPTSFDLGPLADFPADLKTIYQDIPAVIYRRGGVFLAYSLRCTHLGCTLEEQGDGFSCPCHGSEFSSDGAVLKGPALDDLPALQVEINERGNLILHTEGAVK
jgi:Rieske Fe-S protein